ncbi:integral membrane protein [Aspergillus heterothallicus]
MEPRQTLMPDPGSMPDPNSMATLNSGPALMRGIWAGMAVAIVIVILRIIAKIKIRHFRLDDVLMIAALIISLVSTAFLTISIQHGFGSNLRIAPLSDVKTVLKCFAIQWPLMTMSTSIARCSFICYLLAILGSNRTHQILLWATLLLQLAVNIVSAVLPTSICRNPAILWDQHVDTSCGDTTAVIKFSYFTGSLNSAVDLFLALFATFVFWSLNLTLRIKISLVTLLSLGIVAMVASIIKTTKLNEIPSITNLGAAGGVSFFRWGYAENAIIIITSSIPCLRSLAISSVRKIQNSSRSAGEGRSYALTSWRFHSRSNRLSRSHSRSQGNNGAGGVEWPRGHGVYRHEQGADSLERIFDLDAAREDSERSARKEEGGRGPTAKLDIRITKQVRISYMGANPR